MRGTDTDQGGLFSYVSMEQRIPPTHPLRRIRTLLDEAAHATRGWCESLLGFDWVLGDAEFDKALALEPQHARALYGKGRVARALGRISDALRYYQAVLHLDPINPSVLSGLSFTLVTAKRPAEGVQQARRMLDLSPNYG